MVQSVLHPKTIYPETTDIEPDDFQHETYEYDIIIDGSPASVVFGKVRKDKPGGVVYSYTYYINKQQEATRIGVLEFKMTVAAKYTDDNGGFVCEEDVKLPPILLFRFVNRGFLKSLDEPRPNHSKTAKPKEDDIFTVRTAPATGEQDPVLNVFSESPVTVQIATLPEESKEDANQIKTAYTVSPSDEWMNKLMKNKNYKQEDVGGCIIAALFHAFQQIGRTLSTDNLRELIARNTTEEQAQVHIDAYKSYYDMIRRNESSIEHLKTSLKTLKQRAQSSTITTTERQQIVNSAKKIKEDAENLLRQNRQYESFAKHKLTPNFLAIRGTVNSEQYRLLSKTNKFCPDIYEVERIANVKFIVMNEDAYKDKSHDSVLVCGEPTVKTPDFYIIVARSSGYKYSLVSYRGKKILTFSEIPYDIKMLIINKCLEHNADGFSSILDFRRLQMRMGIPVDAVSEPPPTIVFMFSSLVSQRNEAPGFGSGERIPMTDVFRFVPLANIVDWRNKLSDAYTGAPFSLTTNEQFCSVENAYQSRKYAFGYPDFSAMFMSNSNSPFSNDPHLAKLVGSKGPHELRPKHVKHIDKDFYGERCFKEKYEIIKAKFTQHPELKQLLISTHPAHLVEFVRGKRPEVRHDLMRLRDTFMN